MLISIFYSKFIFASTFSIKLTSLADLLLKLTS